MMANWAADVRTVNVLIVEDHEITRLGLRLTLEPVPGLKGSGEACDGHAALVKVNELRPQVVLMDTGLPVMDGIEARQKIKVQFPDVRVIMLTWHDNHQDIFAALASGADGYCLKEVTSEQLSLAIRTVFEGAAWLDPGVASRVLRTVGTVSRAAADAAGSQSAGGTPLSQREVDVLRLVVEGLSNEEIADRLCLSIETVKTHMRHIMEKLAVSDRTQAAVKAMREGLV